jgi:hypothetical protein
VKATLLHRDGDRATVRLTPGRIGRWLGAQTVDVELVRILSIQSWRTEATMCDIEYVKHGGKIRHALDFVPVTEPPRAVARDFVEPRRHR